MTHFDWFVPGYDGDPTQESSGEEWHRAAENQEGLRVKEWDVFLSHATEDKADVAVPLADALERAGIRVWVDDRQLRIGDSIREKIDEGLSRSRYGAVILSPNFVAKPWPRRELNALFALEEGGTPLILPVWHNIDRATVLSYSPILADRLAANTNDGMDEAAKKIAAVVLNDPTSPAGRLLGLLDAAADPDDVKSFLLSHPQILGYATGGGRNVQVHGDVSLGDASGDLFVGTFQPTALSWSWYLIMLGKVDNHPADADDPLNRIARQVSQMRRWTANHLFDARSQLPDLRSGFSATIVLGRRAQLSPEDETALRDFNDLSVGTRARTYDWFADAARDSR
jgi:hypothetical protein